MMRHFLPLFCLLFTNAIVGQVSGDWHKLVLPPAGPQQIARACDGWICRTPVGFYRSADDGQTWIAIETQNLPSNGLGLHWRSNKQGLVLSRETTTAQDPICHYWTEEYWGYNCQTHLFEIKYTRNSHSCWHSGGVGGSLSSINNDTEWFYRLYPWQYGGSPPPCNEAYKSTDGGQNWSSTFCNYATTQHTDSLFYVQADSLWIDPPGPVSAQAAQALPTALQNAGYKTLARWADKICILAQFGTTFKMFISTDWRI